MTGRRDPAAPDPPVHREQVRPDWIDYNGHLSEAYYVLVFGHATDALMDRAGLDASYRERTGCSLYTVEAHVRYLREVPAGSTLEVTTRVLGAGTRKLWFCHEMRVAGDGAGDAAGSNGAYGHGTVAATEELLALHVDSGAGRASPFPAAVQEALRTRCEAAPEWAGRGLSLPG